MAMACDVQRESRERRLPYPILSSSQTNFQQLHSDVVRTQLSFYPLADAAAVDLSERGLNCSETVSLSLFPLIHSYIFISTRLLLQCRERRRRRRRNGAQHRVYFSLSSSARRTVDCILMLPYCSRLSSAVAASWMASNTVVVSSSNCCCCWWWWWRLPTDRAAHGGWWCSAARSASRIVI